MNDDFGYMRSVIDTLQHGRPWTDDSLEPWSAGLSVLSALAYVLTHSFQCAIQGVQAALAGAGFWAASSLLRRRGLGPGQAVVAAALLLTTPTIFWKTLEYTGIVLTLPCLLLALMAAERRRWGAFLVVWGMALATRQSAAAWGMLPLAAAVMGTGSPRAGMIWRRLWPAAVFVFGVCIYFAATLGMNKTHAQSGSTDNMLSNVHPARAVELAVIGGLLFLAAAGVGGLVQKVPQRRAPWWIWVAAAGAGGAIFLAATVRERVYHEHGQFAHPSGIYYLVLLGVLALLGWLNRRMVIRPEVAVCAGAAMALVCLRQDVWDYYFLDVVLLGFFGGNALPDEGGLKVRAESPHPWVARFVAGVLIAFHVFFVVRLKADVDRRWAGVALTEKALRSGTADMAGIRFLPYGYIGWELFPLSIAPHADGTRGTGDLFAYLDSGSLEIQSQPSGLAGWLSRKRAFPAADKTVIAAGKFRYLWCFEAEYRLVHRAESAPVPAAARLPPGFDRPIYPLNDSEWSDLIRGTKIPVPNPDS